MGSLLVGLVAVLAACRQRQRPELARSQGPGRREDRQPLHPDPDPRDRHRDRGASSATVVFALKFRHREGKPDNPKQIHGSTPLEIGWTIVPALILAVVAVPTIATIFDLAKEPKGPSVLQVTVDGKQWWWQFQLPKQPMNDKKVVTSTELHIPVGTKVYLSQSSDNVIHSFWVPELNGKKDVVPGRVNHNTIEADEARHLPRRVRRVLRALARRHAVPRHRAADGRVEAVARRSAGGPGPAVDAARSSSSPRRSTSARTATSSTTRRRRTSVRTSRTWPAGPRSRAARYEVNRKNLVNWVLNAPSMVPMQSKDCRLPPPATCVGMPSFTKNTPKGQPVMTHADAETIVDYLLGEK